MVDQATDDFSRKLEAYPWDSPQQKKGFLALATYMNRRFGKLPDPFELSGLCFLIQANHEAAEYFNEVLGTQVSMLQDSLRILQEQNRELSLELMALKSSLPKVTVELLVKTADNAQAREQGCGHTEVNRAPSKTDQAPVTKR